MGRCVHCGGTESMSFTCAYCGRTVCSSHRLPEKHECTHQSVAETLGPDLRARAVRDRERADRDRTTDRRTSVGRSAGTDRGVHGPGQDSGSPAGEQRRESSDGDHANGESPGTGQVDHGAVGAESGGGGAVGSESDGGGAIGAESDGGGAAPGSVLRSPLSFVTRVFGSLPF